ncbi:uncharacterized protein N0V89_011521 [Didymosphaeria variabile]|uniref:Uncharacterized protein n=1 Tax=Didymosphaeria variabile TaxID=1932322 RepID=A0A9W9C4U5_9PLEO|nr:uncharacterized protein N0V89_011521 [Didymosphaeria variabile]KAJ4345391.1 hypothetical protein N0V89_011521 [Didymosphaeria variabile]
MVWLSAKKSVPVAAAIGAIALGISGSTASPVHGLAKRINVAVWGYNVGALAAAVKDYLRDINAYNIQVPDTCKMTLVTSNGAGCKAFLWCGGSDTLKGQDEIGHVVNDAWNVCYKDGEQFMHDDELGDFSVTFTQAGGVDGNTEDGLHHPVLKVAGINDWEPLDIQAVIDAQGGSIEGNVCKKAKNGAYQSITYTCGIPKLNANSLFGMSNYGEDYAGEGYEPGWCTAHVSQYQRNEFGNGGKYAFDVVIYDGAGNQITTVQHQEVDDEGNLSITSRLPVTLELHSGGDDADFVSFDYGDQAWTCDDNDGGDHACTLGNGKEKGYENGSRNGDMGWTC